MAENQQVGNVLSLSTNVVIYIRFILSLLTLMTRQSTKIGVDFKEYADNLFVVPAPNIIEP